MSIVKFIKSGAYGGIFCQSTRDINEATFEKALALAKKIEGKSPKNEAGKGDFVCCKYNANNDSIFLFITTDEEDMKPNHLYSMELEVMEVGKKNIKYKLIAKNITDMGEMEVATVITPF